MKEDTLTPLAQHRMLVRSSSLENAVNQVLSFFDHTQLVKYDKVVPKESECFSGVDESFNLFLENGVEANKEVLVQFVDDLKTSSGISAISDFITIEQGYPSKVLHLISHLLDGFIGIDTKLYNLIDDSHWLSPMRKNAISENPDKYWLISVTGYSATPETAGIIHR